MSHIYQSVKYAILGSLTNKLYGQRKQFPKKGNQKTEEEQKEVAEATSFYNTHYYSQSCSGFYPHQDY